VFLAEQYLVLVRVGVSCLKLSLGFELGQWGKPGPVLWWVSKGCSNTRAVWGTFQLLWGRKHSTALWGQRRPDGSGSGKTMKGELGTTGK